MNSLAEDFPNPVRETYRLNLLSGFQAEVADPSVRGAGRQAQLIADAEKRRLQRARVWWTSPRMTELALRAAPDMPPFRPSPGDLPSTYGFMYFAVPFDSYGPEAAVLAWDPLTGEVSRPPGRAELCAVSWGPWDCGGTWAGGGTWFTFWAFLPRRMEDRAAHQGITVRDAEQFRLPPLLADNEVTCPARAGIPLRGGVSLEDAVRQPGSVHAWMHLVLCAARLMADRRLVSVGERVPDSAAARRERRRAGRAGVAAPRDPVCLVDALPLARRSPAPGRGGRPGRAMDYQQQVKGHWKRQWYATQGRHLPVFIEDYWRGPEGAPVRPPRDTVYLFREPGEAARRRKAPGTEAGPEAGR